MSKYLIVLSELFLALLHLLIIQKYLKTFLGPEKKTLKSYIEWSLYYIFLLISNIGINLPPHLLLSGNVLLIFIISSSSHKKSIMQRSIFSLLICTAWMLVEVIVMMILNTVGFDAGILKDAGASYLKCVCFSCQLS